MRIQSWSSFLNLKDRSIEITEGQIYLPSPCQERTLFAEVFCFRVITVPQKNYTGCRIMHTKGPLCSALFLKKQFLYTEFTLILICGMLLVFLYPQSFRRYHFSHSFLGALERMNSSTTDLNIFSLGALSLLSPACFQGGFRTKPDCFATLAEEKETLHLECPVSLALNSIFSLIFSF